MRQTPLIDTGSSLPSPLFTPRPGWGGKLASWLKKSGYGSLIRAALMVVVLLSLRSFVPSPSPATTSPSPTPMTDIHQQVARPGEGIQTLATRAIDAHFDAGTLDAVQRLWAVYQLTGTIPAHALSVGETIDFTDDIVTGIIAKAQHISALTRASLLPYLKK